MLNLRLIHAIILIILKVTFGMTEEMISKMCSHSKSELIGYVPYSDLRMNINDDKENAFKDLADQGQGIQIFMSK